MAAQFARAPHKFVHQRAADALAAPRAAGNDVLQMRHAAPYPKNGGADHLLVVVRGETVFAPFPIRRRDRARKAVGVFGSPFALHERLNSVATRLDDTHHKFSCACSASLTPPPCQNPIAAV